MYVCNVCMYGWMDGWMYGCVFACAFMYGCMYTCMHACMHVCVCTGACACACARACLHACVRACARACVHAFWGAYMYRMPRTYTRCIHMSRQLASAFVSHGIALLAPSSPCWSLANRNELIYKVRIIRDLFEVPQYTPQASNACAECYGTSD